MMIFHVFFVGLATKNPPESGWIQPPGSRSDWFKQQQWLFLGGIDSDLTKKNADRELSVTVIGENGEKS